MPEVNVPQQQQPMEAPADSAVVTQQPGAQEQMNTEDMSLRGGCGETIDCCGITESCGCC
ncbi:hypothetical protein INS49_007172 [Diaporthe citri]|uniref:uncharacterized protein n=1 Tax=Diaporthe citri TaxID=83186 RepID=UPI001C8225AC|nr:uncharacterized protein INS49_007172 [Diaporthe citri]KAG6365561.1 hypothetical protein INS49_007172 [Diaporthe citri]